MTDRRRGPTTGTDRDALRASCVSLYVDERLTLREVAGRVDRSADTVARLLDEAGHTPRPRHDPDRQVMVRLQIYIPVEYRDAMREYAEIRGAEYNDTVLFLLGKVLGIEWRKP